MKSTTEREQIAEHRHDVHEIDAIPTALVQYESVLGDLSTNVKRHLEWMTRLVGEGRQLIVFPELSLTGYFVKDLVADVALSGHDPIWKTLADAAGDAYVVVGGVLEEHYRMYNVAVVLHAGEIVAMHKKVFLPTYGIFDDRRYFASGNSFSAIPMSWKHAGHADIHLRAGLLICEDMWHMRSVVDLMYQDVDLLICISASPTRGVGASAVLASAGSYDAMTRTYAQLSSSYVLYCNRVGMEDGIAFWGGSRFIGPDGLIIGEPADRGPSVEYSAISPQAVRRVRIATPLVRDEMDRVGMQWVR